MKRVALVGLGFIGKSHLEAYRQMENVKVAAICTKHKHDAKACSSIPFVSDYDALLNDESIDVIDLCVPTYLHEEFIIKAAQAKKHIICEKPLTLTKASADRIYEEVQQHGVRLFVGQVLRFWPEYQTIKDYQGKKYVDHVEIVHARRLGQLPSWSTWFQHPEKSGGALYDLHLHDIDFVYYLLGEVDSVYAVGTQNPFGAWNHIMTTLSFKGGAKAFIEASHRMPEGYPFTMAFRIQGSKQTIDFELKASENIDQIKGSNFTVYDEGSKTDILIQQENAFQAELRYFIDCIENNQVNSIVPLADVLYVIRLLEAVETSLKTNQVVKV
ncbi:Gfo/Idh/MocA family oxidoreductase [Ornithinibacillus massiliensis]|uniref:Gfo/Idh/MocA family oxidoreductase n=1 Tax=Ornithinibacillus massiliensis TaxID=1944633 RepID=A0ABS5MII9_9BACI|nr:Gfo/Idh/MocA family oxidoreductase [Ornithinibacillus massiliensis]MBS3681898.1 Gfo/Idh/MocA family oxidoreductase [Ornithinibacillus massiliensis]